MSVPREGLAAADAAEGAAVGDKRGADGAMDGAAGGGAGGGAVKRARAEAGASTAGPEPAAAAAAAAAAGSKEEEAGRRRRTRIPDHFKDAELLALLGCNGRGKAVGGAEDAVRAFPQYPLCRGVVFNVVASVRRMRERRTAPEGADLAEDSARHALVRRIVQVITGERLPEGEGERAEAAYAKLHRALLDADRGSQRVERSEPWVPGAPNAELSAAFTESREKFRSAQKRPWLDERRDPFEGFRFSLPPEELASRSGGRLPCPKCGKSTKLYCHACLVPTDERVAALVPVRLPVQVDVMHHRGEPRAKSSALQGSVLSPGFVRFLEFPEEVPEYSADDTVLLYPDETSTYLEDMDLSTVRRCIVVEAKWKGSRSVAEDPRCKHLRHVKIRSRLTTFWRHQELGNEYLATLEAMYWFCVEHFERGQGRKYDGSFDDLMLLFAAVHSRVRQNDKAPRYWEVVGGGGGASTSSAAAAAPADEKAA